jgi:hypothetical protein
VGRVSSRAARESQVSRFEVQGLQGLPVSHARPSGIWEPGNSAPGSTESRPTSFGSSVKTRPPSGPAEVPASPRPAPSGSMNRCVRPTPTPTPARPRSNPGAAPSPRRTGAWSSTPPREILQPHAKRSRSSADPTGQRSTPTCVAPVCPRRQRPTSPRNSLRASSTRAGWEPQTVARGASARSC